MKTCNGSIRIESGILQQEEVKKGVIYLYDDIGPDEYDWWNGEVIQSETSEKFIRDRLAELGEVNELDIHISSRGGYVQTGINLYTQIKAFPAQKKTAYIDGIAASVATVIAMAADEVVMNRVGLMMIHNALFGCIGGNAAELRKAADDLDVITSSSRTAYLEHSAGKITEEKLRELMDAESWLTAEQCLEYGLCDRIIESGREIPGGAPSQFMQSLQAGRTSVGSGGFAESRIRNMEEKLAGLENAVAALKERGSRTDDPPFDKPENRAKLIAAMLCGMTHR